METKVLTIDEKAPAEEAIKEAARLLKEGQLVAIPTETVYGLAADGLNERACRQIFQVKGRPGDNPLILHVGRAQQVRRLIASSSPMANELMKNLWPGPLTMIFKKSPLVPYTVTGGGETVAIRMPDHPVCREIINATGSPLAAPSANLSGRPSPTRADDVLEDLDGKISLIVDGGDSRIGIESTVLDLTGDTPLILRPGFYTREDLREYVPGVEYDPALVEEGSIPRSPGQKYRHYAPRAQVSLYMGQEKEVLDAMREDLDRLMGEAEAVALLTFRENLMRFQDVSVVLDLGRRDHLIEMARLIFRRLRECDQRGVSHILVQGVDESGIGTAIMNRLRKAAGGRVFNF